MVSIRSGVHPRVVFWVRLGAHHREIRLMVDQVGRKRVPEGRFGGRRKFHLVRSRKARNWTDICAAGTNSCPNTPPLRQMELVGPIFVHVPAQGGRFRSNFGRSTHFRRPPFLRVLIELSPTQSSPPPAPARHSQAFDEAVEAHAVLSDAARRRAFDRLPPRVAALEAPRHAAHTAWPPWRRPEAARPDVGLGAKGYGALPGYWAWAGVCR